MQSTGGYWGPESEPFGLEATPPQPYTSTLLPFPHRPLSPAPGYLNVLVNSQWRSRWCLIRDGQLWFYSDKGKGKVSQPAVALGGCSVVPLPSPEHLYTFRIELDGTELATLEVGPPGHGGPLAAELTLGAMLTVMME